MAWLERLTRQSMDCASIRRCGEMQGGTQEWRLCALANAPEPPLRCVSNPWAWLFYIYTLMELQHSPPSFLPSRAARVTRIPKSTHLRCSSIPSAKRNSEKRIMRRQTCVVPWSCGKKRNRHSANIRESSIRMIHKMYYLRPVKH